MCNRVPTYLYYIGAYIYHMRRTNCGRSGVPKRSTPGPPLPARRFHMIYGALIDTHFNLVPFEHVCV